VAFGDVAGLEIVRPLAVVLLGGLVTSALVDLFALPALYLRFGPRVEPEPLRLERAAAVVIACLALGACGSSGGPPRVEPAARVEAVQGSDLRRVTLSEDALKRLDLRTQAVSAGAGQGTQVAYSAVIYDTQGATWVFVSTGPRTFVRAPVTVDHIQGDVAFLSNGPPLGTQVVTVGVTELYGAEVGVGLQE
jgi:hypothetical protein